MRRIRTWLFRGLAIVGALLAVLAAGGWLWLRSSLPQTDGTLTLAGLGAPVEVLRDADGLVTIKAAGEADGAFALGVVHAQDRLWQMDSMRRLGAGRLSEVTGRVTLGTDRLMRTLGLYRKAEESLALATPALRALLESYTAGVNAVIAARRGALPPEFILLGYEPEPWRPADSLVWGHLMALRLSGNRYDELLRARLATRLSARQIDQLWPPEPQGSPTTLVSPSRLGALTPGLDQALAAAARRFAAVPDGFVGPGASNAWVVAGAHTASGKPLLANDPHLGFQVPGTWYLARIETPERSLVGATAPGTPLLIAGHNGAIAWGFTTTHSDTQDFVIERVDPADPGRYLTPDGPRPFEVRDEFIGIADEAPVRHRVRATRHGPVLSDGDATASAANSVVFRGGAATVLALAWPALSLPNRTAEALYGINHAADWPTFVEALRFFDAPQQNIVYADVAGNIGFHAPARVPLRIDGDGQRPVPGWDRARLWSGFIPFEALPRAFNPPTGRLVNANNRIVPDDYPFLLSADWHDAYRAQRIEALLDGGGAQDLDASAAIQQDPVSLMARELLPLLLGPAPAGARAAEAHALMTAWDGTMDRNRAEPLIFAAWMRELNRAIYADELAELFPEVWAWRPRFVIWALTEGSEWCDDIASAAAEDCANRVTLALERALDFLAARHGDAIGGWRWGDAHRLRFAHPLFRHVPLLDALSAVELETDGGHYTVNRGTPRLDGKDGVFGHVHGAGLRALYDLADLDAARFMTAFGQSGNPLSPHYGDLTRRWRDGEYLTLDGDRAKATHRLQLQPG